MARKQSGWRKENPEASPESFRGWPPGFRVLNWSADFQIGRFKVWRIRAGSEFGAPLVANAAQAILAGTGTISVHGRQKICL
jgi:hypothetical protein